MTNQIGSPGGGGKHFAYSGNWNMRSVYALAVLTLIYMLNYLDRLILSLVMPLLQVDLELTDTQLGLISGVVFVLFYSIMGIPIARLADRFNRRNILGIGLAFWSLMTALSGLVTNVWQLAVARFLMGAGEAAGVAPSTSMLSDIFSKRRRPLAMGILTSGTSLAILLFFPVVGWIAESWGWRVAFISAGVPGILLSLVLYTTVAEPERGATETAADKSEHVKPERFWVAIRYLLNSRAYILTVMGGALVGISLYASLIWNPSFFTRVHELNLTQVGTTIGLVKGLLGLAGAVCGGVVTAWLSRRDSGWYLWTPGLACVLVFPAELLFLLPSSLPLSLIGFGLASLFTAMHIGPVYAVCQYIAKPAMRATATAGFLLVANLVGQILGPLVVGYLNDRWAAEYGDLAIRYSLMFGAACAAAGGLLMILGGMSLRNMPEQALEKEKETIESGETVEGVA